MFEQGLSFLFERGELVARMVELLTQGVELGLVVVLDGVNLQVVLAVQFEEEFDEDEGDGGEGEALVRGGGGSGGEKGRPGAAEEVLGDEFVGLSVLVEDGSALVWGEVTVGVPGAFAGGALK